MKKVIAFMCISFVVGLCYYDIMTENFYGNRATSTIVLTVAFMLPMIKMIEKKRAS
ncbi:hypothetical protein [Bacillus sp. FJAT-42315]|uniref:hypothetical protein n=1 Tax=Bacillus sp. FJAT-42315 TaxID=2014077 RepID=UPI0012FEB1C5|nr:hypothetical protein [Bacillus sp. FJAT-42315]